MAGDLVPYTAYCRDWRGVINPKGYGVAHWSRKFGNVRVHRMAYRVFVGPIPPDLVVDHLCRNRACWNPDHLELVTGRVNTLRGIGPSALNALRTHCHKGHPFEGENLAVVRRGALVRRVCKTCRREFQNARNARLRSAA